MLFAKPFRAVLLCLTACAALLPLQAQGDPRLQSGTTDLLDVYQASTGKPELLTVFDFSGSMHAIYWQGQYYTGPYQDSHNPGWNNMSSGATGDFPGIAAYLDSNGYIYMYEGTGYFKSIYMNSQSSQFAAAGSAREAVLVAPNGTTIPLDHTKTYTQNQLDDYVKQASHIRVTATATVLVGGINQTVTRTVDLPIPWAILDPTATTNNNAYNTIVMVTDPSGGPAVTPDTLYTATNQDNIVNDDYYGMKIGRFHYNKDYLWWVFFGTDVRNATNNGSTDTGKFVIPAFYDSLGPGVEPATAPTASWTTTTYPATTWKNGLQGMTRFQALKNAVVRAWFANQTKVYWGYRYIDDNEDSTINIDANNGNQASTATSRDVRLFATATGGVPNQQLRKFLANDPSTSTPLAHAFANAYAQLAVVSANDAGSAFGPQSTENPIPACRNSFLVVFTDGIANDAGLGTGDPYAVGTAAAGNTALGALSNLRPGYADFNIWTLAGVAAHYKVTTPWTGPSKGSMTIDSYAPWLITSRGATSAAPRRAWTMTVAMSVAGSLTDAASGKADLFRAALYGNPGAKSWSLSTTPFDPTDLASSDPNNNPFFFDATNPDKLSQSVTAILNQVVQSSASISAPSSPLVGLSLGNQVYLGLFQNNINGGPRWQGDLLMTGLLLTSSGVNFLDNNGAVAKDINEGNAVWSVYNNVFNNFARTWKTRNIYTNLLGTTTLVPFDESTASLTTAMVGATTSTDRTAYIRFMRGAIAAAETDVTNTNHRPDILGDIVNSSPGVLEYPIASLTSAVSPKLAGLIASVPSGATPRFRVIVVGDNQGIFHAFGELSYVTTQSVTVTNSSGVTSVVKASVPHGDVDELWAFIPGELLQYIPQLRVTTNPHRYWVDGSPYIYFKDVPASGQVIGNGLVDGSDVVRVIVSERKGGRSYFAFDFANLANVVANTGTTMAWKLVPDDIPSSTTNAQQKVLARMGFSTGNPAVGRVETASNGIQDLLFLGGGLSLASVDTAFVPTYGSGTKLGRSLIAFDVVNGPGTSLYTWNFTDSGFTSTFGAMGCIATGVVPFEFFPGSNRAQRVYFVDTPTDANVNSTSPRGGAVWALGNTALAANGVIRLDSSNIDNWTNSSAATTQGIRKILQTNTGWSLTTLPAPFLLNGPYPAVRAAAPLSLPVAVGIAIGTGDRNDPMDNDSINPAVTSGSNTTAYNNWMTVVFDRQDSSSISGVSGITASSTVDANGIQVGKSSTDGDLADLTTVSAFTGTFGGYSIDPSNSAYYLKKKLGYKLNLGTPAAKSTTGYYYPKVITNTVVLSGVLYFSDFTPSGSSVGSCQGVGITNTYRICKVLQPTFNSGNVLASTSFNSGDPLCTGIVLTYANLPGELTALGTTTIIQSGQGVTTSGVAGNLSNAGAQVGGAPPNPGIVGFRPRSWRIVR